MHKPTKLAYQLFALLIGVLGQAPCRAEVDADARQTVVSGFGTLGALYNSRDDAGFIRSISQRETPGRQYSWRPDSLLGIQLSHTVNPQLQVIGQAVLRSEARSGVDSAISRAFVSYRPTDNLKLRLGRMADATFLMSDYAEVGYAYPWVRPPAESYKMIALTHYDGVDATYSLPVGDAIWRIKGLAGSIKVAVAQPLGEPYILAADDLRGVALMHERGPLKVRLGHTALHLANEGIGQQLLAPFLTAFAAAPMNPFRGEVQALSDSMRMCGTQVSFTSLGVAYDDGTWMAQAEISRLASQTAVFPRGQQGYVSLGRHFGDFLPYVMVSGNRAPAAARPGGDWAQYPLPGAAQLQGATLALLNQQRTAQTTTSLGVRWDFDSRAALKLQWDRIRIRDHGWGLWSVPAAYGGDAATAQIVTATIDFVF